MKKIFLLLTFSCIALFAAAQSQRTVLFEEFTSGTCPPSATGDPIVDTLLAHNTDKVVSIIYQGPGWPSPDPMYQQNPVDVDTRSTYYAVPYVPYCRVDGMEPGTTTPTTADFTQAVIDSVYAIPSSFSIAATSSFNAAGDSMMVNITITCSANITISQPKLHVAIVENRVHFAAPLSAGLKDFYTVMRKMLPNGNGTAIVGSWTTGQTQSFQFTTAVDPTIFNLSELAVVAFIQDVTSKEVFQAGYAPAIPAVEDAGIFLISSIPAGTCGNTFEPILTIKNYGDSTLTSSEIYYSLDGASPQVINWNGSLAANAVDTIMLPTQTIYTNTVLHTFNAYTVNVNTHSDFNSANNEQSIQFIMPPGSTGITGIDEDFTATLFPVADWCIDNPDKDRTWSRYTGTPSASIRMEFFNIPSGNTDYLYLPVVDLTTAQSPLLFTFDLAYRQYSNELDSLNVQVSTDCGQSWNIMYAKSGSVLATVPPNTTYFVPYLGQWRNEIIDFNSLIGQPNVLVRLQATSRLGNNLYIDNMNLYGSTTGISASETRDEISIFPNPSSGAFTVAGLKNKLQSMNIYNAQGKLVHSGSDQTVMLDLNPGIYSVQIIDEKNNLSNRKIIIQ
jgi:hypothetical protein